jgi:nucleotide-binding universal stress UspA family protein
MCDSARTTVLVISHPAATLFGRDGKTSELAEQIVGDAAAYLRAHGYETEEAYAAASAKHALLPYAAEWGADLIVAGNSAKSLLLRRAFGETALNPITCSDRPRFLGQ